jgi:hypothetical protein
MPRLPSSPSSAGKGTGASKALAGLDGWVRNRATRAMKSQTMTLLSDAAELPTTWSPPMSLLSNLDTFTIVPW